MNGLPKALALAALCFLFSGSSAFSQLIFPDNGFPVGIGVQPGGAGHALGRSEPATAPKSGAPTLSNGDRRPSVLRAPKAPVANLKAAVSPKATTPVLKAVGAPKIAKKPDTATKPVTPATNTKQDAEKPTEPLKAADTLPKVGPASDADKGPAGAPTPTPTPGSSPSPTPTQGSSPSPTPTETLPPRAGAPTPTPTPGSSPSPTPTPASSPSPTPTETLPPRAGAPTPTPTPGSSPSPTPTNGAGKSDDGLIHSGGIGDPRFPQTQTRDPGDSPPPPPPPPPLPGPRAAVYEGWSPLLTSCDACQARCKKANATNVCRAGEHRNTSEDIVRQFTITPPGEIWQKVNISYDSCGHVMCKVGGMECCGFNEWQTGGAYTEWRSERTYGGEPTGQYSVRNEVPCNCGQFYELLEGLEAARVVAKDKEFDNLKANLCPGLSLEDAEALAKACHVTGKNENAMVPNPAALFDLIMDLADGFKSSQDARAMQPH